MSQVLVNAADHSSRNPPPDPKDKEAKAAKRYMSELRVVVDEVRQPSSCSLLSVELCSQLYSPDAAAKHGGASA